MKLTACRWSDFQHYKNRRPPWIRLHRTLLDNPQFQRLPVASRALAPMLWLLASESMAGEIELTPGDLAFKLRMKLDDLCDACNPLILAAFFDADEEFSGMLAACLQVAAKNIPETETETDIAEASQSKSKFSAISHLISIGVDADIANDWIDHRKTKKAAVTKTAISGIEREAQKAGWSLTAALAKSCERGWTGFKAEWVAGEVAPNVAAANPGELITLPDGSQITRAQQDFLKRVMA